MLFPVSDKPIIEGNYVVQNYSLVLYNPMTQLELVNDDIEP